MIFDQGINLYLNNNYYRTINCCIFDPIINFLITKALLPIEFKKLAGGYYCKREITIDTKEPLDFIGRADKNTVSGDFYCYNNNFIVGKKGLITKPDPKPIPKEIDNRFDILDL